MTASVRGWTPALTSLQTEAKRRDAMLNYAWSPVCQVYLTFFGGTPTPIGDGCRSRFVSLADLDYELRLCGLVRKGGRSRGVIATDGAL